MTEQTAENGPATATDENTASGPETETGRDTGEKRATKRGRPAGSKNKPKKRPDLPVEVADYVRGELQSIISLCEIQKRNPALPSALKAKTILSKLDSRLKSLVEMLDPACEVLENG